MDTTCWLPLFGDTFAVVVGGGLPGATGPVCSGDSSSHLGWAGQGQPGDRHAVSRRLVPGQVLSQMEPDPRGVQRSMARRESNNSSHLLWISLH